ncbi:MAG: hypothetical protein KatS3mg031_0390 [Chitinophagales bacterium]|nr:MAG: hypothetical protein KatS3mg031_0390 [Chitinophagales bacterium]
MLDALEQRFFSIEADVFYAEGRFCIAHTSWGIRKKKTLESLYLMPLSNRYHENKGNIYTDSPQELELMLDLKGVWSKEALDSLNRLAERYRHILTVFVNGEKQPGAVRLLLSGDGAKYLAAKWNPRYFSIDGGLSDIDSPLDANVICRVSAAYRSVFRWRGRGVMPAEERLQLKQLVTSAHEQGRKIRFWACPQRKSVWNELLQAGVDWINVDNLSRFSRFYSVWASRAGH